MLIDRFCKNKNFGLGGKGSHVNLDLIERLRNENEDKTKTQMTQSFNQYSENETKI